MAAMTRTASGEYRAVNMIRRAPTNGAHVMIKSAPGITTAAPVRRRPPAPPRAHSPGSLPPSGPDDQQEETEGDAIHVILGLARLQPPQQVSRPQRPRAGEVEEAVHEVAIDPADEPREGQHDATVESD